MIKYFVSSKNSKLTTSQKSEILTLMSVGLMIMVVLGHTTRMFTAKGIFSNTLQMADLPLFDWITTYLYSFHMPAFFSVSGCVFYIVKESYNKYNLKKQFVKKKILRLIVPYYVFLILIVLPILYIVKFIPPQHIFGYIKGNLFFIGDSRHLWYLPTLFGIFILFYFSYSIFRNHKFLSLCICLLFWTCSQFLTMPVISNICYYLIFFYLGYLSMHIIDFFDILKKGWFILGEASLLALICCLPCNVCKLLTGIVGLFMCMGLSWRLVEVVDTKHWLVSKLKENSYGMYLFHPMVIYIFFFYIVDLGVNPYVMAILIFTLACIVSFLLTEGMRRCGLRFCIGE